MLAEERVDALAVLVDGRHERGGELVGRHRQVGEHLRARAALRLGLVEQAEGALPRVPPLLGERHRLRRG